MSKNETKATVSREAAEAPKVQVRELTAEEAEKLPYKAREAWENSRADKPSPDPFGKTVIEISPSNVITILNPDGTQEEVIREHRSQGMRKGMVNAAKVVEVDGEDFQLQRRDPYGFWYIVGPLKDDLGTFTGHEEATQSLIKYLKNKKGSSNAKAKVYREAEVSWNASLWEVP